MSGAPLAAADLVPSEELLYNFTSTLFSTLLLRRCGGVCVCQALSMAFDEARRGAAGGAGASLSRGNSSRTAGGVGGVGGASGGYQSGGDADAAYSRVCSSIEDELRRLTASVATLRKLVEAVGSTRDSDDLRSKMCVCARAGAGRRRGRGWP